MESHLEKMEEFQFFPKTKKNKPKFCWEPVRTYEQVTNLCNLTLLINVMWQFAKDYSQDDAKYKAMLLNLPNTAMLFVLYRAAISEFELALYLLS